MPTVELLRGVRACVFDVYGTLLDLESAVRCFSGSLGPAARQIAWTWRSKQLEYAWVASLTERHVDFAECTAAALETALRFHGADVGLRDGLLRAFWTLEPFTDAASTLARLREAGLCVAALSNGAPHMLNEALSRADLLEQLDQCLSIEEVGVYKPARAAYALASRRLGLEPSAIAFVSGNAWDVVGALRFGFAGIWIKRNQAPPEYDLASHAHEITCLSALPDLIASRSASDRSD